MKFRYVVGVEQKYDVNLLDGHIVNTYYGSRNRSTGEVVANGRSFLWPNTPIPYSQPVVLFDEPKRLLKDELLFAVREQTVFDLERFGFVLPELNKLFLPHGMRMTRNASDEGGVEEEGKPWHIFHLEHGGSNDFLYRIHKGLIEFSDQLIEEGNVELLKSLAESSWFTHVPAWDYRSLEGHSLNNIWYVKNERVIPSSLDREAWSRKFKLRVREFLWNSEQIWLPWYTELLELKSYDLFLQRLDVKAYVKEHNISLDWR